MKRNVPFIKISILSLILIVIGNNKIYSQCVNISSYPTSANAGTQISISGTVRTGLGARPVYIFISSSGCSQTNIIANNTVCANSNLTFSATLNIPCSTQPGDYYINALVSTNNACNGGQTGCSCISSESKSISIGCTSPSVNVNDNSGIGSVVMTCSVSGGCGGNKSYKWYNGTNCTGTPIGYNQTYTATTSGNYACKAYISGYESTCYNCDYGYATVIPCTNPTVSVDNNSGYGTVVMTCNASGGGGTILYKWYSGTNCTGTPIGYNQTYTATSSGNYACKAYISGYESTCYNCDYGYAIVNPLSTNLIINSNKSNTQISVSPVDKSGISSCNPTCNLLYDANTNVLITAQNLTSDGYNFVCWQIGSNYYSNNPITITMNTDYTITALYDVSNPDINYILFDEYNSHIKFLSLDNNNKFNYVSSLNSTNKPSSGIIDGNYLYVTEQGDRGDYKLNKTKISKFNLNDISNNMNAVPDDYKVIPYPHDILKINDYFYVFCQKLILRDGSFEGSKLIYKYNVNLTELTPSPIQEEIYDNCVIIRPILYNNNIFAVLQSSNDNVKSIIFKFSENDISDGLLSNSEIQSGKISIDGFNNDVPPKTNYLNLFKGLDGKLYLIINDRYSNRSNVYLYNTDITPNKFTKLTENPIMLNINYGQQCSNQNIYYIIQDGDVDFINFNSVNDIFSANNDNIISGGVFLNKVPQTFKLIQSNYYIPNNSQIGYYQNNLYTKDPVDPVNGNFFYKHSDFTIGGKLGLTFERYYNSQYYQQTSFGNSWSHNFNWTLNRRPAPKDTTIFITSGDGRVYFFKDSLGIFSAKDGTFGNLTKNQNSWIYTSQYGTNYFFYLDGILQKIKDNNNNELSCYYSNGNLDSIVIPNNQKIKFHYNPQNFLDTIYDPLDRKYVYEYDSLYNLKKFVNPRNDSLLYFYSGNYLTQYKDFNSNIFISNSYDFGGRVTAQKNAFDITSYFNYLDQQTEIINISDTSQYFYDNYHRIDSQKTSLNYYEKYSYSANQDNRTQLTGFNNEVYNFSYSDSSFGNVTKIQNPLDYDLNLNYLNGNISKIWDSLGTIDSVEYDSRGLPTKYTDANNDSINYEYDENGYLKKSTKIVASDTLISYFTHDIVGRLLLSVSPANDSTWFGYNDTAHIDTVKRRFGQNDYIIIFTKYDGNGNVIYTTSGKGDTTFYHIDCNNNLDSILSPLKYPYKIVYDSSNNTRKAIINAVGDSTHFVTDAMGRLIETTDPLGRSYKRELDANGNILKSINPVCQSCGDTTTFLYNSINQMTQKKNAEKDSIQLFYDIRGNVNKIINEKGVPTILEYDGIGNLKKITNAYNDSTVFFYNSNSQPISTKLPSGANDSIFYDKGGNIFKSIAFDGKTSYSDFDNNNLLFRRCLVLK